MNWMVRDTIEDPYFLKGLRSVEEGLPLEEVCQLIPNQLSYERGRLFNIYLKSMNLKYSYYLTESGQIKSEAEEQLMRVIYPILSELDLVGLI